MRGLTRVCMALLAFAATTPPVNGQTHVLVGLSSTFPVGTVASAGAFASSNAGWQGTLGIDRVMGSSRVTVGARAFYGANGYEGPGERESSLLGLTSIGVWTVGGSAVAGLLWSEAGLLSHRYSADSGGLLGGAEESSGEALLVAGGLGARVPLGSSQLLILGGYSKAFGVFEDITYLLLTAMTRFAIG